MMPSCGRWVRIYRPPLALFFARNMCGPARQIVFRAVALLFLDPALLQLL
jgi:hypothetical protein